MEIEKLQNPTAAESSLMLSIKAQLIQSLNTSKEYRHSFVEEKIRTGVAAQIKAMRESRCGTQAKFAKVLGKAQSWVARLEDPNAKPATLSTLLEIAVALDVDLVVRFGAFSELVDWMAGLPHVVPGLSEQTLAVKDFEHDEALNLDVERAKHETLASILGLLNSMLSKFKDVEDVPSNPACRQLRRAEGALLKSDSDHVLGELIVMKEGASQAQQSGQQGEAA